MKQLPEPALVQPGDAEGGPGMVARAEERPTARLNAEIRASVKTGKFERALTRRE
jgi:hypothetical protein